jgi:cytochrome c-type biogenesis protein CcmE
MRTRTIKLLATIVVVLGAGGLLIYNSLAEAEQHYQFVQEVMPEPDKWVGKTFKIHGVVEPGSIREEIVAQKTERQFVIESKCDATDKNVPPCPSGQVLRVLVRHSGPKPDTFKELAEVIAQGTLNKEGQNYVFVATELLAKCPSKYKEDQRPSEFGKAPR